jgi:hypothetical protein
MTDRAKEPMGELGDHSLTGDGEGSRQESTICEEDRKEQIRSETEEGNF